jgi:hypothetical protein
VEGNYLDGGIILKIEYLEGLPPTVREMGAVSAAGNDLSAPNLPIEAGEAK